MCNCGYTNDPKKKQETTFRITLCGRNASARSGGGVFGEENPCLLDSLNGLGVTYMRQGRFDEAIKLAEKRPRPIEYGLFSCRSGLVRSVGITIP